MRVEAQLLELYDYAWNKRGNSRKRQLHLEQRLCCFCIGAGVDVVESEWHSPAKLPSGRARSPARQQQQLPAKQQRQRQQPAAARQLQFIVTC